MIFDKIENIDKYISVLPHKDQVNAAIKWITSRSATIGRKDFSSDVYLNISEYTPKSIENGLFENHEEYIDIQILLKGNERFFVSFESQLKETTPYNVETDCRFFDGDSTAEVLLTPDNFVIALAQEPHMPGIAVMNSNETVQKAVIKIKKQ